jgi:hypothetical protein
MIIGIGWAIIWSIGTWVMILLAASALGLGLIVLVTYLLDRKQYP